MSIGKLVDNFHYGTFLIKLLLIFNFVSTRFAVAFNFQLRRVIPIEHVAPEFGHPGFALFAAFEVVENHAFGEDFFLKAQFGGAFGEVAGV